MAENESAADYGCQEYFKEAVCIDAQRVYDSCSDKDCIEDIRVLFPAARQSLVDSATNVRVREVNVITVYIDLQPIPFNQGLLLRGHDLLLRCLPGFVRGDGLLPVPINGVAIFNKKVVLYGSEGNVKLFTSGCSMDDVQAEDARVLPKATVQVGPAGGPPPPGCASIPPAAASPIAASPRASASATAATSTAAPRRTRCTSPLGCSSSCRWCATCKCSSPPTTSACPRRSAWPPATTPVSSSAASTSPPASFSRRSPQTWVGPVNDSRRQAKRGKAS